MFTSRKVLSMVAGLGLLAASTASSAGPVAIGDPNFLGTIVDGIPSSPGNEVTFINALNDLAAGALPVTCAVTETCNRVGSTLAGPFSDAILAGAAKDETAPFAINATGYEYILGKYDADQAGSLVWYFAGGYTDGVVTLPGTFNGFGLSHISLYNSAGGPPPTQVPEPGTALLAGLALLGLAASRKRRQA